MHAIVVVVVVVVVAVVVVVVVVVVASGCNRQHRDRCIRRSCSSSADNSFHPSRQYSKHPL